MKNDLDVSFEQSDFSGYYYCLGIFLAHLVLIHCYLLQCSKYHHLSCLRIYSKAYSEHDDLVLIDEVVSMNKDFTID
jgi:hypothetical protein